MTAVVQTPDVTTTIAAEPPLSEREEVFARRWWILTVLCMSLMTVIVAKDKAFQETLKK